MAVDQPDDALFAAWELDSERSLESMLPATSAARPERRSSSAAHFEATRDYAGAFDDRGPSTTGQASRAKAAVESLKAGDDIGGFRLIVELGRGAFARVFLAHEGSLGGRAVALKISRAEGDEPQSLARLQHANIVPVHSVRDDPATGLRLLCMPYLGGANLAEVLEEAWASRGGDSRGRSLADALDQLSRRLPARAVEPARPSRRLPASREGALFRVDPPGAVPPRPAGPDRASRRFLSLGLSRDVRDEAGAPEEGRDEQAPTRRFLRHADPIRAAAWVVARLAEGLDHAHSRGVLHRDLKPSNVLITGDGTPMLLDFNLSVDAATEREEEGSAERAMLGGTLPYMSPEHLDALDPDGVTPAEAVDERSDLYALGLILFEMIAGAPAFPSPDTAGGSLATIRRMLAERRAGAPSLRSIRPEVPPSLAALVAKCVDPEPELRYHSAAELAEDLRRFLEDLPMRHGPEPSLKERLRKWARRHPSACSSSSVGVAGVVIIAVVLFGAWHVFEAMQGLHARLKLRKFQDDALECRFLLNTFGDEARILRGLELAATTLEGAGVDEARGVLGGPWIRRLTEAEREEVRLATVDLILLACHARVVTARKGPESARREALVEAIARLDRLQRAIDAPPATLYRRRARYRAALGDAEGAAADRRAAEAHPVASSQDWTSLGMVQLADGEVAAAERSLRAATEADLGSFWAWFALGHCHFAQDRYNDAVADFTACVVSRPDFAWGHFNRGLALARAGRPHEARAAYARALELDPTFEEARANRGLVELELDRPDRAEADLRAVVGRGRRDGHLAAALADALVRQDKVAEAERLFDDLLSRSPSPDFRAARGVIRLVVDPVAAADDFRAALDADPSHALAHYGMARVLCDDDRTAALAHLDRAIATDPTLYEAVELRALARARQGDRAALDDVARLVARPTANRLYNAACALAILGEAPRAVDLLGRAVLLGFPPDRAVDDPDLASLRRRPDYAAALARKPVGE
ncbi:tetratricopeptide repeat protein [Paludisphaera sp.]|uniref:protein kinase domain-containing protein n=1 Tax=Paludisphaera sp. TaxID=2017432 RepID=UPI00301C0ABA